MRSLLIAELGVSSRKIHLSDRQYGCYAKAELVRFLSGDGSDLLKYKKEVSDCDDFTLIVLGREREWYRNIQSEGCGSSLGLVWGDLRHVGDDEEPNYHAMLIFVDGDKYLWFIEPQTDEVFAELSDKSSYSLIVM